VGVLFCECSDVFVEVLFDVCELGLMFVGGMIVVVFV